MQKNSLLKETSETVAEEPEVEQVTPKHVLKRSSRAIRVPDRYVPSLHYLLLTDEGELETLDEALQLENTTKWEQAIVDGMSWMSRLQNCVAPPSIKAEYVAIAEVENEMIWITYYLGQEAA